MAKKKNRQPAGYGNIDLWRAMDGLRSSSAAQRHTPKTRKGTRGARKRQAVRDFH